MTNKEAIGELKPAADNSTIIGRAKNRRVEIKVYKSGLAINSSTAAIDLDASTYGVCNVTHTTTGSTTGSCVGIMTQKIYVSATITDFNYAATSFALTIPNANATITGTINLLTTTPGNYNVSYTPPFNFNPLGADLDGQRVGDEYRNEVALTKLLISWPQALVIK